MSTDDILLLQQSTDITSVQDSKNYKNETSNACYQTFSKRKRSNGANETGGQELAVDQGNISHGKNNARETGAVGFVLQTVGVCLAYFFVVSNEVLLTYYLII